MLISFVFKPKHTIKYAMLYNYFLTNSIKQDVLFKNLTFHSFFRYSDGNNTNSPSISDLDWNSFFVD